MSDEDREELTRGEDFAAFERRMMSLFDRMAARVEEEAEARRRRDEEWQRRNEALQRGDEELQRRAGESERKIEFILQQQAQFSTDMQRLREAQEANEQNWARADERWTATEQRIIALLAIAEMHEREFFEMRQAQAESQARTDAQVAEARARADAKSAETDDRLNALINTVERLISERRNGDGKREENSG